jgi:predicted transcriptional regulator
VPKSSVVRPTDAELAILRVLWQRGPSTVREVFDVISEKRDLGYTTVLKVIQIMSEKGLIVREEQGRNHIYRATRAEEETQRHLVADLLERAFGGSTTKLVMQALASKRASPKELREIRRLLDQAAARSSRSKT